MKLAIDCPSHEKIARTGQDLPGARREHDGLPGARGYEAAAQIDGVADEPHNQSRGP